jgi:hypothetical protein
MENVYKYEKQVGFKFSMPYGRLMEIYRCSDEDFEDSEIERDEKIAGIHYIIKWNGTLLPWCTDTELEAMAIAMGCQFGAEQVLDYRCNFMR